MSSQSLFRPLLVALGLLLAACGSDRAVQKAAYKEAETLPPLEVPAGLDFPMKGGELAIPEVDPSRLPPQTDSPLPPEIITAGEAGDEGAPPERAEVRTVLEQDAAGQPVLRLEEGFARAWRRVGLALERIGMPVEDRDRSRGIYYLSLEKSVVAAEPDGHRLAGFFTDDDEKNERQLRVVLSQADDAPEAVTRIVLQDEQGQPENPELARAVLGQLRDELK